jgi:RimJ/RimL family protein N-acetyltransferase
MDRESSALPELIEDDGVTLRRWQVSDAERLGIAVAESIEHLRPWMPWIAQEPMTLEERRAMHANREREYTEGGDVQLMVVVDDRVAGSCGLHRRLGAGALELGYWIHPAFTRRGLGTKVARMLTTAAFSVHGIERVEIHHDKANRASAGVARRLGFRFLGETPDEPEAPGELGVECAWRMCRPDWDQVGIEEPAVRRAR